MIIPVYKPLGVSTHKLAEKVGAIYGEKATHTGTLDPMAEGVVVVLTGDDRFSKEKQSSVAKEYQFKILLGFSTDSHDLLGKITYKKPSLKVTDGLIGSISQSFTEIQKKDTQIIPHFSAKRYKGKSFFDAAKYGTALPVIPEPIQIHSLSIDEVNLVSAFELRDYISTTINEVPGDFRQKDIISAWSEELTTAKQTYFTLLSCSATTSKRTYIRGIVRDLSEMIQIPCTTFSIIRTRNGEFSIADSVCIL